jgi:hypothetical protein
VKPSQKRIFTHPESVVAPSMQIWSKYQQEPAQVMAQSEQLLLSIDNLFLGRGTQDANVFIQHYSETKECWQSAVALLDNNRAHVRYFCANILYNKV